MTGAAGSGPRPPEYDEPGPPLPLPGGGAALRSFAGVNAALAAGRAGQLTGIRTRTHPGGFPAPETRQKGDHAERTLASWLPSWDLEGSGQQSRADAGSSP